MLQFPCAVGNRSLVQLCVFLCHGYPRVSALPLPTPAIACLVPVHRPHELSYIDAFFMFLLVLPHFAYKSCSGVFVCVVMCVWIWGGGGSPNYGVHHNNALSDLVLILYQ